MTREEAIEYGKRVIELGLNDETQAFCEMAISALSAEGEYIKKEDAINLTWREPTYTDPLNVLTEVRDGLNDLSTYSFHDREKGEWIEVIDHESEISKTWHYECSVCSKPNPCMEEPNFCPNCGADMRGKANDKERM